MPRIALNDPQVPYIGIDTDADNYLDKVPVALYGPNGEALLVKTPTGETARVIGSAIYGSDGTDFRPVKLDASGRMEAVLSGSSIPDSQAIPTRSAGLQDFATGAVTVTATQVELKAGASALAGRKQMIVYPPSAGTIYWGKTGVTSANGAPLSAGDPPLVFDFDPATTVAIYAVNDGTDRTVKVVEVK